MESNTRASTMSTDIRFASSASYGTCWLVRISLRKLRKATHTIGLISTPKAGGTTCRLTAYKGPGDDLPFHDMQQQRF